jgi:hypothetical protein
MFVNRIKICPDLHKIQLCFSRLRQCLFLKLLRQWTKFRGRKLFVTNCATEHSHYLILTTVTSISNHLSRTRSRLKTNFVAKNLLSETRPRSYQNINISFAIHSEEVGQLSRENLDQWNRAIFPSCLRRFLAVKFVLDTEELKKYI